MPTLYPCVPGHEIVGRVASVGFAVTKFKGSDRVGVGCLVDSCGTCAECRKGLEQFCPNMTMTWGSTDATSGGGTLGGYSAGIVEGVDYFADTLLFAGAVLAVAKATPRSDVAG